MQNVMLSSAEKLFRIQASQLNVRLSSRGFYSFRPISIENETNKTEVNVGETKVLVGINFEADGKPLSNNPKEGYFKFKIDWSPHITSVMPNRKVEEYSEYLKSLITEAYINADIINLSDLCITPNKKCWIIYVDIIILECDGNLLDVISIGIHSALKNTKIPKINLAHETKELKFNFDNCPIYLTVNKMDTKYLIDADREEENCSAIRIMTAVLPNGQIKCTSTDGEGSLKAECLLEMLKISSVVGIEMHKSLEEYHNTLLASKANNFDNVF